MEMLPSMILNEKCAERLEYSFGPNICENITFSKSFGVRCTASERLVEHCTGTTGFVFSTLPRTLKFGSRTLRAKEI